MFSKGNPFYEWTAFTDLLMFTCCWWYTNIFKRILNMEENDVDILCIGKIRGSCDIFVSMKTEFSFIKIQLEEYFLTDKWHDTLYITCQILDLIDSAFLKVVLVGKKIFEVNVIINVSVHLAFSVFSCFLLGTIYNSALRALTGWFKDHGLSYIDNYN